MKTLAELKRDASSGNIKFELFERYGNTGDDIIEELRGIRKVQKVNSAGIVLENTEGQISLMRLESANLVEYDGETLTIYDPGIRDLTEQEQKIMDDWYKVQEEYIKEHPYSNVYWKKKDYFEKSPCPWLAGYEKVKGKSYYCGKVIDNKVRGEAILKYRIIH